VTLEAGIERTESFAVEGRLLTDVRGTLPMPVLATPAMNGMIESGRGAGSVRPSVGLSRPIPPAYNRGR
jgi:hypothetical protein